MSTDPTTPLFVISDGDDPTVTQAKANLAAAERVQQERAEQRRLERAEWKAWVLGIYAYTYMQKGQSKYIF